MTSDKLEPKRWPYAERKLIFCGASESRPGPEIRVGVRVIKRESLEVLLDGLNQDYQVGKAEICAEENLFGGAIDPDPSQELGLWPGLNEEEGLEVWKLSAKEKLRHYRNCAESNFVV